MAKNDSMWSFLREQKSSPDGLENAVNTLINFTEEKSFSGAKNRQLDSIEMVKFVIICEAAALVLSEDWKKFREWQNERCRQEEVTQREAECMIRFVDALRIQFHEGREADFCEPCCGCSHVHECKSDTWYENTRKLSSIAGVSINLALPTQQHK